VILPFGDAHARAYQEKIDFNARNFMSLFLTLVKKTAFKYFAKMVEVPRNIFIKNNDISLTI
jgi:hypothetical protein